MENTLIEYDKQQGRLGSMKLPVVFKYFNLQAKTFAVLSEYKIFGFCYNYKKRRIYKASQNLGGSKDE